MNWKAWAPLAVAIVLGLVAAVTARNLVSRRPAAAGTATGPQVVVIKQAVLPGQEIRAEDVAIAPLAFRDAPEGTFKDVAEVVGRVATLPLVKGQPVLESLLAATGSGSGLQALVPEGMRAITIEVNEVSSVAGLVGPGCTVDVVATIEDTKTRERLARTIVQGVKVMAVGQRVSAVNPAPAPKASSDGPALIQDPTFKSVTLLTTPEEAEALELASMVGRPRLVLRGQRDSAATRSEGVSVAQLIGNVNASADLLAPGAFQVQPAAHISQLAPATRPAVAPPQHVVRVIRGGVESTVTFDVERTPERPAPAAVFTHTDKADAFPQ